MAHGRRRGGMPPITAMRLGFSVFWLAVFVAALINSRQFPGLSGVFPQGISVGGIIFAVTALTRDLVRWRRHGRALVHDVAGNASTATLGADGDAAAVAHALRRAGWYTLWLFFYFLLIWLVSVIAASGIFVAIFLAVEARASWKAVVASPLLVMAFLYLLALGMNLHWPDSLTTLI